MAVMKTNPIQGAMQFVSETKAELRKVAWPTKKETTGITGVVVIACAIMGVYLGVVDWLLAEVIKFLIR